AEQQEMQFTYTTPEFGEIEIRTTVKHDQVGAMISVPDPRLRELLHSNLDYLDNALSQQSLQLGTFQATTSDSHSGRERAFDPRYSPIRWNAATDAEHVILPHVETYAHNGALDLRA
ncbi:MAG TPA: flagellar hook-length control protein FliK, partial [Terriglobales bacterium]